MKPITFRTRGIRDAMLLAALLSCVFPRPGAAAVPPPPDAAESGKARQDAPVMLAALAPPATEPRKTQSDAPVMLAALPPPAESPATPPAEPFMLAALPPAGPTESEQAAKAALSPAAAAEAAQRQMAAWMPPQFQVGGRLSYLYRSDTGDIGDSRERGLMASLLGRANAPIWQPWLGSLLGEIDYGILRSDRRDTGNFYGLGASGSQSVSARNTFVNGRAQLALVPLSKFPFEAHFERNDGRSLGNLSALDSYTSQRAGFSQNFNLNRGNIMFGWDRNTQNATTISRNVFNPTVGEFRQDIMKVSLSQNFGPEQAFQIGGSKSRNTQENSDQLSEQRNWYARHSVQQRSGLTVETTADGTSSLYHVQQGTSVPGVFVFVDSDTSQRQLNSLAIWKPAGDPLTINGGLRVMGLENSFDGTALGGLASSMQTRMANLSLGAAYDLSKNLQLTGSANVNLSTSESQQITTRQTLTAESAGVNYRQDPIPLGDYNYLFSGGTALHNRNGGDYAGQQLTGQLSHSLNRTIALSQGSNLNSQVSQAASASWDNATYDTRQLTHSAMAGWNMSQQGTTTLLQLSATDSRSWGANPVVFQLINLQATGNLITSQFSSWSGGLTVQMTRQNQAISAGAALPNTVTVAGTGLKFATTSSGSVGYQNQQAFDVPQLRFNSDLKLNSQALLPAFGGPQDQETRSWDNRLEYAIGRVQLRLNARLSKVGTRMNRSYLFMLSRAFGDI